MPRELSPTVETSPTDFQESLASETPPVTCQPCTYAEVAARPPDPRLQQAELVYVKRGGCEPPLTPAYSGPYRVIRPGCKFFLIEVGGCQESVSVDRLKPHTGKSPVPEGHGGVVLQRGDLPFLLLSQPHRSLGMVGGGHVEAGDGPVPRGKSVKSLP